MRATRDRVTLKEKSSNSYLVSLGKFLAPSARSKGGQEETL